MFDKDGKLDERSQRILAKQTIPPRYGASPGMQEMDLTPDRQRQQTMAMVHFVMQAIDKYIPDDGHSRKHATYDLFDALDKAGVDVITNEQRTAAGLPLRGPKGWTEQELHILEAKRIEAMLSPIRPFFNASSAE